MKFTFKVLTASLLFSMGLQAQRTCGTKVPDAEWDAWFNQKVLEHNQNMTAGKTQTANFNIPVIVHVIHGGQNIGTYPNLTQTQINSQITVLNNDFAGVGLNSGNLAATGFSTVGAADCSISFCLAQLDESGNTLTEWGIDRVNYNTFNFTNPGTITSLSSFQNYMDGTIKPATIWDPTRYFNIWVCDMNSNINLLGYATFPTGTGLTGISGTGNANNDGIVVYSRSFGNTGMVTAPYHRGRTVTHEIGHWLGLRHITGDAQCGNDFCADTPPQKNLNFGCPNYPANVNAPNTCGSQFGDMFMNFMDYCDDACLYMFTPNQSSRMTTAMTNGTYRNQLTASSVTLCNSVSSNAPVSSFVLSSTVCVNTNMFPLNQSSGSPSPTFLWSIQPNGAGGLISPNTSTVTPTVKFTNPGTYTVNLTASSSAGSHVSSHVVVVTDCSDVGLRGESLLQSSIQLAPNPTSGMVQIISTNGENQSLDVTIHNYLGQFVSTMTFKDIAAKTAAFDMSTYANGVYFITISNGQDKAVKRLILNK
ncbi:MAG: T9SS type A sorting domain-containing protein [Bacteroidota bacterium]